MPKVRMSRKDSLVEFCRALPGATEDVKWGKDRIVAAGLSARKRRELGL